MLEYSDYDFYENVYRGPLDIDLFNSLIPKASREIDKAVNRELTEVDITDKVKFVACEMVDYLNTLGKSELNGGRLTSVSVDGVSKHYANIEETKAKITKQDILSGLPLDLIRFL